MCYYPTRRNPVSIDNSLFIKEVQRRMNDALAKGSEPDAIDIEAIETAIINDPAIMPEHISSNIRKLLQQAGEQRTRTSESIRKDIKDHWRSALDSLDECLAYADFIHARLMDMFANNGREALEEKSRKPPEVEEVKGAELKCLLLISLHARSCVIASEVALLIRNGFLDGAEARLRSLHEHIVTIILIANDKDYEISERYQDRACFEELKRLRARQRHSEHPAFNLTSDTKQELADEISKVETIVTEARARRGKEIEEQYGWARPALPDGATAKRVYFSDLEKAAGMDFLRAFYIGQNNHVHAGAFATINHLDIPSNRWSPTGPRHQVDRVAYTGFMALTMIDWASHMTLRAISRESQEYDEIFYYTELSRLVDAARDLFSAA